MYKNLSLSNNRLKVEFEMRVTLLPTTNDLKKRDFFLQALCVIPFSLFSIIQCDCWHHFKNVFGRINEFKIKICCCSCQHYFTIVEFVFLFSFFLNLKWHNRRCNRINHSKLNIGWCYSIILWWNCEQEKKRERVTQ